MFDPLRAKAKTALYTGATFLAGLGFASGLGWTQTSPTMPTIDERPALSPDAVKPASDLSEAFVNIADVVTPAVVRIQTRRPGRAASEFDSPLRFFGPRPDQQSEPVPELSGGSGFILSPDGYIMTNHHVVKDADQVTVFLRDRRYFQARVIGGDPFTDVAVIKIDVEEELPHLSFGDSETVQVGQWVLAVGNPGFGTGSQLDYTVTAGIVSARGRGLDILSRELRQEFGNDPDRQNLSGYAIEDFIQTDAVINPGNSGGPMVSLTGQVVGINSAIASMTGYYQGYGFAIPINLARRVMEDLIEYGHVRRPLIGVEMTTVTPEDAELYGLPSVSGAMVQRTTANGPAAGAGIRPRDVIVAVDGKPIGYSGQLQQRIAEYRPGDRVTLTVYRERRPLDVAVRLGEAPINDLAPRAVEATSAADERLGIRVELLDARTRITLRTGQQVSAAEIGYDQLEGVVITDVQRGSAADQRGIAAGARITRINGLDVADPEDVRRALDSVRAGQIISFDLEGPTGSPQIVNVRMPAR
jgi:serine protease Do